MPKGKSEKKYLEKLNEREAGILAQVLMSPAFQNMIGAEEWDLSEDDEHELWVIIKQVEDQYAINTD